MDKAHLQKIKRSSYRRVRQSEYEITTNERRENQVYSTRYVNRR